jgi:rfaE bifunctional protein nucleotidyltransferase chain/domain
VEGRSGAASPAAERSSRRGNPAKIKTLAQLGEIAATARAAGRAVVLCHGVFDLLHLGHIRHIDEARREGDMLIVTVTADAFVNKGPDRPIFNEVMRAEMLAALASVDWVGVNYAPTAEPVLETIRPSVYVKGSEYENAADDVTGKIVDERASVERHGGRVFFTNDVTFSSSSLINRHLNVYDPPLHDLLTEMRDAGDLGRMIDLVERTSQMRVLLVGDAIIDEYKYVTGLGKPSKENIVATQFLNREVFAGGVLAAANHVASFCRSVEVVTTLGEDDDEGEATIRKSLKPNVSLYGIRLTGRPLTRKSRFVDPGYYRKLFEVYYIDDSPLAADERANVNALVAERAAEADLVIVTDFGHGLIDASTIDTLCRESRFLAVNTQANAGNYGYNLVSRYKRADFVCLDAPEARLAVADKFSDIEQVITRILPSKIACERFIITHGKNGCYGYTPAEGIKRVPAFTKTVVDTIGAGDAFFAVAAPLAAAGGSIQHVAFLGNAAGAIKVGVVGHRESVEKARLIKFITALLK